MTAQNPKPLIEEEKMLPKEPLDLPKELLDLPKPEPERHHDVTIETILEWSAPGRPFKKKSKQYYLTGILIALLVEVILFLFSQYMLMLVVISLIFVAFALATIPPKDFKYRISTEGITIEDHFFLWQELYDFYFKKREGVDVVHIRTHSFIPGELTLTLGDKTRDQIKSALLSYLPYRELVRSTSMEKAGDWLAKNFPLEKPTSEK